MKIDWTVRLSHVSCLFTIIIVIWAICKPYFDLVDVVTRFFLMMLTFIGGIMVYIPLGIRLEEIRKKYGRMGGE